MRRASIAAKRLRTEVSPYPSRSTSFLRCACVPLSQRENVGRRGDQLVLEERLDLLLAQPLDVESIARDEVAQPLHLLCRADEPPGTAADRLALFAHRVAAAGRTHGRKDVGLGALRPFLRNDAQHLRDDIAGALDGHGVADAHVFARDLVLVVQRRVLHHHAADRHRFELGDRRERAGAADLDLDRVDDRYRLLGRELVRDRPARAAVAGAEPRLPVEPVKLVDDAVDVVIERAALELDLPVELKQRVERVAHSHQRVGAKAAAPEPFHHAGLGVRRHRAHLAPAIGEEPERARRGDRGILLAQRAGGRVARIGEHLPAGRGLAPVEIEECRLRHVDFAAHLADDGHVPAAQLSGNIFQRPHIGGDILAHAAVAASRGIHQATMFVPQRQRETVDLWFGGENDRLVGTELEEAADALDEIPHVVLVEGVVERKHRDRVPHLGESARRLRADPARRRIRANQLGEARLDLVVAFA